MSSSSLQELYQRLYPICRSITGKGYRESLAILQEYIPFELLEYRSGTKVFDWTVPDEWILTSATLKDSKGNIILNTEDNPMCLVNYSEPFTGRVSKDELFSHLYSIENQEDTIPYVTSYYKKRWGFCVSERFKQSLTDDFYEVDIQTQFDPNGAVVVGVYDLKGESDRIIQISSYLCHSCMLNNELSGPLGLVYLYQLIKNLPQRKFTYRFVLNPETIGSIAYLSDHFYELQERLEYGLVINCLATPYINPKTVALPQQAKNKEVQAVSTAPIKLDFNHDELTGAPAFYAGLDKLQESITRDFIDFPLGVKLSRQACLDCTEKQNINAFVTPAHVLHANNNSQANTTNLAQIQTLANIQNQLALLIQNNAQYLNSWQNANQNATQNQDQQTDRNLSATATSNYFNPAISFQQNLGMHVASLSNLTQTNNLCNFANYQDLGLSGALETSPRVQRSCLDNSGYTSKYKSFYGLELLRQEILQNKELNSLELQHSVERIEYFEQSILDHYVISPLSKALDPEQHVYKIDGFFSALHKADPRQISLYDFVATSGSDERQYCSALLNLPVVQISRTKYDSFKEYHTADDCQQRFSLDSILDSALKIFTCISIYERNQGVEKALLMCEPQLGKRGLYPDINSPKSRATRLSMRYAYASSQGFLGSILQLISLADGRHSILDIAKLMSCSPFYLLDLLYLLESKDVLCYKSSAN